MIGQNKTLFGEQGTIYNLPKFLSQIQHITSIDTGNLQFIICCDRMKLYIFPLQTAGIKPLATVHQTLPIPNIKSLKTIAKNFLMIETQSKYIGIFQIVKSTSKQPVTEKTANFIQINASKVQFSEVLRWKIFSCYFVRQVMQNLFQVQVFYNDLEFEIFQFTNKFKRGSMSFTIGPNGKILKSNKKQLYGSKCFLNTGKKIMYWLKNFSDKQFILQQIIQQPIGANRAFMEPLGYFGIQRAQQYKTVYANFLVRDCINPSKKHRIQFDKQSFLNELKAEYAILSPNKKKVSVHNFQQNPYNELVQQSGQNLQTISQLIQSYKITIFSDLLMIQNKTNKEMEIYQIKAQGSEMIGRQHCRIMPAFQMKELGKSVNQDEVLKEPNQSALLEVRRWQWYFGNSKKLIGIDRLGCKLKCLNQMRNMSNRNKIQIWQKEQNQEKTISNLREAEQSEKDMGQRRQRDKVELTNKQGGQTDKQANQTDKLAQNSECQVKQEQVSSKKTNEQNEKKQQEPEPNNSLGQNQKRKFSKDQLQKFCSQFSDQDVQKYVKKEIVQKVQEVKAWSRAQTIFQIRQQKHLQHTFHPGNTITTNKSMPLTHLIICQHAQSQTIINQQTKIGGINDQIQNSIKQIKETQQKTQAHEQNQTTKPQLKQTRNVDEGQSSETNTTNKQKPPIKIIQRNKISVAKTFNPQNMGQSKTTEAEKQRGEPATAQDQTNIVKQINQKKNHTQRMSGADKKIDENKKVQNLNTNLSMFSKYKQKQENLPLVESQIPSNTQKQKKRFMMANRYKQKKQQSQVVQQVQQNIAKKRSEIKNHGNEPKQSLRTNLQTQIQIDNQEAANLLGKGQAKEQKKKMNVITRVNMHKKSQNDLQPSKDQTKSEQKMFLKQKVPGQAKLIGKTDEHRNQTAHHNETQSLDSDNQNLQLAEGNKNQRTLQLNQPKTKYVPSIDTKKAAHNQLNDCQFLSEDSEDSSSDQKGRVSSNGVNKVQIAQEQNQIQQEIQTQNIGSEEGSSSPQKDLEFLIDDDINKEKQAPLAQQTTSITKQMTPITQQMIKNAQVAERNVDYQVRKTIQSAIDTIQSAFTPKEFLQKSKNKEQEQQRDIQKFCNTLLEQKSVKPYNYQQQQPSDALKEDKILNKNSKTISIDHKAHESKTLNSAECQSNKPHPKESTSNICHTKSQTNEFNQLGSLLFKTSIKRDNIFSHQNNAPGQNSSLQIQNSVETQNCVQIQKLSLHSNSAQIQNPSQNQNVFINQNFSSQPSQNINEALNQNLQSGPQDQMRTLNSQKSTQRKDNDRKYKDWNGVDSSSQQQDTNSPLQQDLINTDNLDVQNSITAQKKTGQNVNETKPKVKTPTKPQQKSEKSVVTKQIVKIQQDSVQNQPLKTIQQGNTKDAVQLQKLTSEPVQIKQRPVEKQNPFLQLMFKKNKDQSSVGGSKLFPSPPKWLSNRQSAQLANNQKNQTNSFVNFKKNTHQNQSNNQTAQNMFASASIVNGTPNLFRKFLNERQNNKLNPPITQREQSHPSPQNVKHLKKTHEEKGQGKNQKAQLLNKDDSKTVVLNQPNKVQRPRIQPHKISLSSEIMPQIQQLIGRYEDFTLTHLQSQQIMILKSLEQIPHTHNPYNKNHSLILTQEIKQEIIKESKNALKRWLSSKMLDKIQVSFRQIMKEHKSVYEQALQFYQAEAKRKVTTMQLQYEQQSSILTDMENISANMCSSLQSTVLQGEQLHTYQLKQWKRQIQEKQQTIVEPLCIKIQESSKLFQVRNKNLDELTNQLKDIKQILKQKLKRKELAKELKQQQKAKKQLKLKKDKQEEVERIKRKQKQAKIAKPKKNKKVQVEPQYAYVQQKSRSRPNEQLYYQRSPYPYNY